MPPGSLIRRCAVENFLILREILPRDVERFGKFPSQLGGTVRRHVKMCDEGFFVHGVARATERPPESKDLDAVELKKSVLVGNFDDLHG